MNRVRRGLATLRSIFRATSNERGGGWSIVTGTQPSQFQGTGREVRTIGWERNAVVQACARAIVDVLAAVDYEVCREKADGTLQPIPGHEAAEILNKQPRVGTNGHELRSLRSLNFLLYGNSFAVLERGARNRITGVRHIHPERIAFAYVNPDDQVARWDWRDIQGVVHQTVANDMLHVRDMISSPDGLFGFPRAAASLLAMATDREASEYVREVVGNHGYAAAVVTTTSFTNKDDMLRAEDSFNQRLGAARGGRGRAVFMNGEDMAFTPIGFNLTQLEFPDLRAISREDICSSFGVDPRIVGVGSAQASNGGFSGLQFQEARFRLIQQAVIPIMKCDEAELNRWYMPEFGERLVIRHRPDALAELTEDESQTSTRVIAEVLSGISTVEEARETIGRSRTMDPTHHFGGGNKTLVQVALEQAAMDPVEKAAAMQTAVPNAPLPGRETDPQTKAKDQTKPPTPGATPPATRSLALVTTGTPRDGVAHRALMATEGERSAYWRAFDQRAQDAEPTFLQRIHEMFGIEWSRLASLLAVGRIVDVTLEQALLSHLNTLYGEHGLVTASWEDALRPSIQATILSGARQAIMEGPPGSAALPMNLLMGAARSRAQVMAQEVARTTMNQISGLIAVARSKGMNTRDTAALIRETVFGPAVDARAATIARTEIASALNRGANLAAVAGRTAQTKMWVSQRDEVVRESHRHAESQGWIPVEKAFDNGLQYPGDPNGDISELANCRCTAVYSDAPMTHPGMAA